MYYKRYSKGVIEPFAIEAIAKSFNSKYAEYRQPTNTDNFDFLSPDGLCAVEVVTVIPENERKAYVYESELSKGKINLKTSGIKGLVLKEDGSLFSYYGGSISEIIDAIKKAIKGKSTKAERRKHLQHFDSVDLCVCVQDGSLMDLRSYQLVDFDFSEIPFANIFFITPSYFIRYSKNSSFEEYQLIY